MELSGAGEGHTHASAHLRERTRTHRCNNVNARACRDIQKPVNPGHFLRPLLAQGGSSPSAQGGRGLVRVRSPTLTTFDKVDKTKSSMARRCPTPVSC